MKTVRTIEYFIDTENTSVRPLLQPLAGLVRKGEREPAIYGRHHLVLMYTASSSGWLKKERKQLANLREVEEIYCNTGGHNSLDFCMAAEIGRRSFLPDRRFVICSADKGFDALVWYLSGCGVEVVRRERPTGISLQNTHTWAKDMTIAKILEQQMIKGMDPEDLAAAYRTLDPARYLFEQGYSQSQINNLFMKLGKSGKEQVKTIARRKRAADLQGAWPAQEKGGEEG